MFLHGDPCFKAHKALNLGSVGAFLKPSSNKTLKKILGWREIVSLPSFGIDSIKAKIDTGAKTSALHVSDYKIKVLRNKKKVVQFVTHPVQRSNTPECPCQAEFIEYRYVVSSNGAKSLRPVVKIDIKIDDAIWAIEVTLVNRDIMGFRMLLGREALQKKFLVDPARSFVLRKRKKKLFL